MALLFNTSFEHRFGVSENFGLDGTNDSNGSIAERLGERRLALAAGTFGEARGAWVNLGSQELIHLGGAVIDHPTVNGSATSVHFYILTLLVGGQPVIQLATNGQPSNVRDGISPRHIGVCDGRNYNSPGTPDSSEVLTEAPIADTGFTGENVNFWWRLKVERTAGGGTLSMVTYRDGDPEGEFPDLLVDYAPLAIGEGDLTVEYRGQYRVTSSTVTTPRIWHDHFWIDDERDLGEARSVLLPLIEQGAHSDFTPSEAGENYTMINDIPPDIGKSLSFAAGNRDSWKTDATVQRPVGLPQVAGVSMVMRAVADNETLQGYVRQGSLDADADSPMPPNGADNYRVVMASNPHTNGLWSAIEVESGIEVGVRAVE